MSHISIEYTSNALYDTAQNRVLSKDAHCTACTQPHFSSSVPYPHCSVYTPVVCENASASDHQQACSDEVRLCAADWYAVVDRRQLVDPGVLHETRAETFDCWYLDTIMCRH